MVPTTIVNSIGTFDILFINNRKYVPERRLDYSWDQSAFAYIFDDPEKIHQGTIK